MQQSVAGFQVERMPDGSAVISDLNESRACSSSGWHFAEATMKIEKIRMKEVSQEWFWVQCNIFIGASLEIGLTCGGGLKQFLELKETFENDAAHSMDVKRLCGFATSICKATFTFW